MIGRSLWDPWRADHVWIKVAGWKRTNRGSPGNVCSKRRCRRGSGHLRAYGTLRASRPPGEAMSAKKLGCSRRPAATQVIPRDGIPNTSRDLEALGGFGDFCARDCPARGSPPPARRVWGGKPGREAIPVLPPASPPSAHQRGKKKKKKNFPCH